MLMRTHPKADEFLCVLSNEGFCCGVAITGPASGKAAPQAPQNRFVTGLAVAQFRQSVLVPSAAFATWVASLPRPLIEAPPPYSTNGSISGCRIQSTLRISRCPVSYPEGRVELEETHIRISRLTFGSVREARVPILVAPGLRCKQGGKAKARPAVYLSRHDFGRADQPLGYAGFSAPASRIPIVPPAKTP
jgi:hypothetical protein